MAKKKYYSLLTDDMEHCVECGRPATEVHHLFAGYLSGNRDLSEKDGLVIPLCANHHTIGKDAIHHNEKMRHKWQRWAQLAWEEAHPGESFLKRYGKNYV